VGVDDKPGQGVPGLPAGNGVSALKHLVPPPDPMGLSTEADHVSGRDPTDRLGLTDGQDKGETPGAWASPPTTPLTH
jgi:hypothetical protein